MRSQKIEDPKYERNEWNFQDEGKRRCHGLENTKSRFKQEKGGFQDGWLPPEEPTYS